jgi:hypothetical protein
MSESMFQALVAACAVAVIAKIATGLALAPLAVTAALVFAVTLALALRLRRHPRRGQ